MYLAKWGEVYPKQLDDDGMCGNCHQRPATWGDWLCEQCRAKLREQLNRQAEEGTDEVD